MDKLNEAVDSYLESEGISWKKGVQLPPSRWERMTVFLEDFFIKPKWAPWRKQKKEIEGLERDIYTDVTKIYTDFSGRGDFSPQFAADKLKELGWSVEDIKKLGKRMEGIQ